MSMMAMIILKGWCKQIMEKHQQQEIEIVYKGNHTFEQQLQRIQEMNNIFVEIATNYHDNKINHDKKT